MWLSATDTGFWYWGDTFVSVEYLIRHLYRIHAICHMLVNRLYLHASCRSHHVLTIKAAETTASCNTVKTQGDTVCSRWEIILVLPSSFRMVWCGLQCKAPMAFPAQLFQRPWSTQVAVMTEDARLVALHSLDTVAPIVAPSPARPLTKARICMLDIWSYV